MAIPGSVTNLGPLAFSSCDALTNITVDALNPNYASADGVLFDKTFTQLFQYPPDKSGSYVIPGTVTNIADGAFDLCDRLSGVTIPPSVITIGSEAFESCGDLGQMVIPSSVTTIGTAAFWSCWSLTNFTVDVLNPTYASAAGVLFDKTFTTLIQYPEAKNGSYMVPGSVVTILPGAFQGCSGLTAVTLPYGVTSIGDSAFEFCYNLTGAAIPGSVTNIGTQAFYDCPSLASLVISNGVTSIGDDAFEFCNSLTSVTIPDSVTGIGDYAFSSCLSLTNLTISDHVTSIGNDVFDGCSRLAQVTIPASVTNLENDAFSGCTNLTKIYFEGNAPALNAGSFFPSDPFSGDPGTVYYLPGTAGWTNTFDGLPTAVWHQSSSLILNYVGSGPGVRNNRFGFTISWPTNTPVVIEACTNLANPVWQPLQTNALVTGAFYFSDAQWTNYPGRYYRVRSP